MLDIDNKIGLPSEIDYTKELKMLPPGTNNLTIVATKNNGSSFNANAQPAFDLVTRGFLIPSSLYLRYRNKIVVTTASFMKGTQFATPFSRSAGSSIIETIPYYSMIYNFILNTRLNLAQKAGKAYNFGVSDNSTTQTFSN